LFPYRELVRGPILLLALDRKRHTGRKALQADDGDLVSGINLIVVLNIPTGYGRLINMRINEQIQAMEGNVGLRTCRMVTQHNILEGPVPWGRRM